jgi:DNA-binding SARP family transcriptional activator/tetratricopeptide (TPR) repeat protein
MSDKALSNRALSDRALSDRALSDETLSDAAGSTIQIELLDGFQVTDGHRVVCEAAWRRRPAAALVKVLALAEHRRLQRERVLDLLWPELTVEKSLPRLHKAAHYARQTLQDPAAVVLRDDIVALWPGRRVRTDVELFEERARQALAAGDSVACLAAADAYPGELLPADRAEPWAADHRERLARACVELLRRAGSWDRLLELEPADEEAHLGVMRAYADEGNHHAVARQFQRLREALRREVDARPSRAAVALFREALAQLGSASEEMVGRDDELQLAVDALDDAAAGRGILLLVRGEAGMGKSRLCHAVAERAAEAGWTTLRAAAREGAGQRPYLLIFEAIEELLADRPELRDRLPGPFRQEIDRVRRVTTDGLEPSAGSAGHQRLYLAIARLLHEAARERGVLLFVDDLHAADEATLELLHYLVRASGGKRLLVLAAYRPEAMGHGLARFRARLLAPAAARELALQPLSGWAAAELAERRSGASAQSTTVERVLELAGGNPFFIEELATAAHAGEVRIPARLDAVLAAQLQRAAPPLREVLPQLAIAGVALTVAEFVALSGRDEEQAFALLDQALQAGLLVEDTHGYRFRHALIREALVASLPQHRRAQAHRKAAERLAAFGVHPTRVAYHLLAAGAPAEAVPWLERAASAATALGAYRDAAKYVQDALPHADGEARSRLLEHRADLLSAVGDPAAPAAYREAIADSSDSRRDLLRARLSRVLLCAGDLEGGAHAIEGIDIDKHADAEQARLLFARAFVAWCLGAVDDAAKDVDRARPLALASGLQPEMFDSVALRGLVAHDRGEWHEQARAELLAARDSPELASVIFDAYLCWAEYLLYGYEPYERIIDFAVGLRNTAEQAGVARGVAFATVLRGQAEMLAGMLDAAEQHLREAVGLHRDIGAAAGEAHSLTRLAEALTTRGEREQARVLLDEALRIARWAPLSKHLVLRILGATIRAAADVAEARSLVDQAQATIGPDDRCPLCDIMLWVPAATVCAQAGEVERADGYLELAEQSARMWNSVAWSAAVLEARAHLQLAKGNPGEGARLLREAATRFAAAGQPRDAARCAAAASSAAPS